MEIYLIYGINDCPACLRAKADLMAKDKEYVFIDCDFSKSYRQAIKDEFQWPTFPIVVRVDTQDEVLIGGRTELAQVLLNDDAPT